LVDEFCLFLPTNGDDADDMHSFHAKAKEIQHMNNIVTLRRRETLLNSFFILKAN